MAPLVMLGIGGFLLLVGVVLLTVGGSRFAKQVDLQAQSTSQINTVTLTADTSYGLYGDGYFENCALIDPSGAGVDYSPVDSTANLNVQDHDMLATFHTTTAGDYQVACTSETEATFYVGPAISVQSVGGMVGAILGGIGFGIVGLPLMIAGIVWLLVRANANKRATGYPGGPLPPPNVA